MLEGSRTKSLVRCLAWNDSTSDEKESAVEVVMLLRDSES
jgi:hypothetical protein